MHNILQVTQSQNFSPAKIFTFPAYKLQMPCDFIMLIAIIAEGPEIFIVTTNSVKGTNQRWLHVYIFIYDCKITILWKLVPFFRCNAKFLWKRIPQATKTVSFSISSTCSKCLAPYCPLHFHKSEGTSEFDRPSTSLSVIKTFTLLIAS